MKMPAVVNYGAQSGQVELRDIEQPIPGEDDVLLQVAAVNVCGSDLHQWAGQHTWAVNYPVVLGHEFAGTILETGSRVRNFQPADRVVSETAAVIDPDSPLSRQGRYNLDPNRKGFGYGVDGAMTTVVRVPARCLHTLPESLAFEKASLVEPCCVAYNAVVYQGAVSPGDRIVVLGPGPIGLLSGAIARLQGAEVALVGLPRDETRLKVAESYGCTPILGDPTEWAMAGDGLGVHGVIDAAGVSATLKTALEIVRPAGWISKVGWGNGPLDFSLDLLVQKSITLRGSFSHHWSIWERVIDLLATNQLDVERIVGGSWPIEEWEEAFTAMHSGQIVKGQLIPGGFV